MTCIPEAETPIVRAASCVERLSRVPVDLASACRSADDGGLPLQPGFYAWWTRSGSLPNVPPSPHPSVPHLDLLYVGIAPVSSRSRQSLRSRILGNHIRGNTGSSTFRFSLASLLVEDLVLHPLKRGKKTVLSSDENHSLSDWQRSNLRITWCVAGDPWALESEVVATMRPPLNLAGNSSHPFHRAMSEARVRFRESAA
jgi:hypothetical protein